MADLTIQNVTEAGIDPTMESAAAGGDAALNDGRVILLINNGDASSHTVTVTAQTTSFDDQQYGDATKSDASILVPAGSEALIGPFAPQAFNDSNGDIQITYDAVTSMTIAALKITDLKR